MPGRGVDRKGVTPLLYRSRDGDQNGLSSMVKSYSMIFHFCDDPNEKASLRDLLQPEESGAQQLVQF